jgi:hypothetical protein
MELRKLLRLLLRKYYSLSFRSLETRFALFRFQSIFRMGEFHVPEDKGYSFYVHGLIGNILQIQIPLVHGSHLTSTFFFLASPSDPPTR